MKLTVTDRLMVAALLLCITLPLLAQGVYWESTMTGMGMEQKSQMYYLPKKFKNVSSSQQGNDISIVRLDQSKIYNLMPGDKSYSEMSFSDMEGAAKKTGGEMDARMQEMKKGLESMPPEQRQMAEQMMGRMMNKSPESPIQVEKTGETKSISGFNCTKYVLKQGDKEMATIWATKDLKEFESMKDDFREFAKGMMAMNPLAKSLRDGMQKVEGFPIQTDMAQGMKTVVTKVEKRSIAASEFEIPSGYKKVKPKFQEGMENMKEKK
jgi:hypothetical protein